MSDTTTPLIPAVLHRTTKDGAKISYTIKDKMGSGGFGTVYAGEEMPGKKPVAIKCISQKRIKDIKVKKKLYTEVDIHRSLKHKNIVEFKGVFQDENYVYILLELCPNGTVFDMLKKHNPFNEAQAALIVKQLLEALKYLHERRIIHRDLKLQNLLIDAEGNMKLADFGLSAQLKDENDKKMTMCGTPSYLSPEVIGGGGKRGHTTAVDIWATGVCTFLMLTGKQPFQSSDKKITYNRISHVNYSWPEKPKVSQTAKDFINSLLVKNPDERPTAAKVLEHQFIIENTRDPKMLTPHQSSDRNSGSESQPESASRSNSSTEEVRTVDRLPSYAVRIWWDYSHRYGLAYMLHNHICGACFNDSSRIVLDPEGKFCQYWSTPQTTAPEIVDMCDMEDSAIRKKLLLIQHFASELKSRAGQMRSQPIVINDRAQNIPHVKYWARTKEGVLFRMANRDIQANFRDHTKLVIESASKDLYYDTGKQVNQLALTDLSDREKFHEVRKRFVLVKEMAKELV